MITVQNLHKKFAQVHALRGISLEVQKGEIYGFIGRNGAGKSTTMNILAGLSKPHSGTCIVSGKDISAIHHPRELSLGYLPENPNFYPWLTARETLLYLDSHSDLARIDRLLDWVGLGKAARRKVGGYSRGMKQRLGLCTALIHDPQLLILDEPSSALDPEGRSDVLSLIRELKSMGKTVLFSTHILSDVERICDTIGMIASGSMVLQKPLQELLKNHVASLYDLTLQKSAPTAFSEELSRHSQVEKMHSASPDRFEITVIDPVQGSLAIQTCLNRHELPVQSLSLRQHSLEDIFIQEVNGK